jgi:hypothetical protein
VQHDAQAEQAAPHQRPTPDWSAIGRLVARLTAQALAMHMVAETRDLAVRVVSARARPQPTEGGE